MLCPSAKLFLQYSLLGEEEKQHGVALAKCIFDSEIPPQVIPRKAVPAPSLELLRDAWDNLH